MNYKTKTGEIAQVRLFRLVQDPQTEQWVAVYEDGIHWHDKLTLLVHSTETDDLDQALTAATNLYMARYGNLKQWIKQKSKKSKPK